MTIDWLEYMAIIAAMMSSPSANHILLFKCKLTTRYGQYHVYISCWTLASPVQFFWQIPIIIEVLTAHGEKSTWLGGPSAIFMKAMLYHQNTKLLNAHQLARLSILLKQIGAALSRAVPMPSTAQFSNGSSSSHCCSRRWMMNTQGVARVQADSKQALSRAH